MKRTYSWNTINIDLVYGRDRLIQELLSGLPGVVCQSFAVTGGRRMGKTTLLRYIDAQLSNQGTWRDTGIQVVSIYIDGLSLPRPLTAEHIWGYILFKIQHRLSPNKRKPPKQLDFRDFLDLVGKLITRSEAAVRVVVLFDEIEHVLVHEWADGFFSNWRALLSNMPGISSSFSVAFSGARELATLQHDVGSPLMDILEWRLLRNLPYLDACRLMQEPLKRRWSERILKIVYDESGGQPMLMQFLMQQICANPSTKAFTVARKAANDFVVQRGWQFKVWWDKYCTPTSQRVYCRLPENGRYISLRELTVEFGVREANEAVEILQHVGIAESDKEQFRFRRCGTMFSRWQLQFGEPSPSLHHDARLFEILKSINADFATKYASSWAIAGSELPNYSGAVGELRDVITLLLGNLAPDKKVAAESNFQFETNQKRPTRRQRARYIAKKKMLSGEQASTLVGDIDLVDTIADQIASSVTNLYSDASGLTHTTANKDRAYQALKQGDSVLAQLLL